MNYTVNNFIGFRSCKITSSFVEYSYFVIYLNKTLVLTVNSSYNGFIAFILLINCSLWQSLDTFINTIRWQAMPHLLKNVVVENL